MKNERPALRSYMTHRAALVDYAAKIVGDRARAEDIVQDAWLVLSRQGGGAPIRDPQSYLRTTVRNLAIDSLRRRVRERRIGGENLDSAAHAVPHEGPTPEGVLLARADLRCVMGVLATLPDRQRIAIEMYRFSGCKLREIAEHLGVSIPLVHLLISEGLAACAERCDVDFG